MFRPDALGFNVSVISIDGGLNDQTMPGDEVCTLHVYMSKRRLTLSCSLVFFFHFRQIWTTNTQPESHFQRPTYTTQRLELLRQSMIQ